MALPMKFYKKVVLRTFETDESFVFERVEPGWQARMVLKEMCSEFDIDRIRTILETQGFVER